MGDKIGVESNVITTNDNWTGLEFKIWIPISNLNHIVFEETINNELAGVNFRSLPRREINARPQILGAPTNTLTNTSRTTRPNGNDGHTDDIQTLSVPADQLVSYHERTTNAGQTGNDDHHTHSHARAEIADRVYSKQQATYDFDSVAQDKRPQRTPKVGETSHLTHSHGRAHIADRVFEVTQKQTQSQIESIPQDRLKLPVQAKADIADRVYSEQQATYAFDSVGQDKRPQRTTKVGETSHLTHSHGRAHIGDRVFEVTQKQTQSQIESIPQDRLKLPVQELTSNVNQDDVPRQKMRAKHHVADQVFFEGVKTQKNVELAHDPADPMTEDGPSQRPRRNPRKQMVKVKASTHKIDDDDVTMHHIQQNDDVSIHISNLVDTMRQELEILHPISDCVCIYRVPEQLRDLNEKAYSPHIVSIGPFHRGEEKLALMEDQKMRYLQCFLLRSNVSMEELFKETLEIEPRLRNSYAEKIQFDTRDFVTFMLVDGVFILEYLLRRRLRDWEPNDPIFNKQRMTNTIRFDLLLLENQIPFFFLDHLFRLLKKPEFRPLSTIKLVRRFLEESTGWNWLVNVKDSNNEDKETDPQHILDFLATRLLPREPRQGHELRIRASPSIVELHSAGVTFKSVPDRHFLDIQFKDGVLEIPTWKINDRTELLFRNLLAYEQCNPPNHYLSDYVAFMDMLIDVDQDVELLVRSGIIENLLQDNQSVAELVNNLSKNNVIYDKDFYFSGIVEELKSYCERPWHKWKANLKQEYFKNPWTIISVIAAVFLLLLTILQSVCSVLQVL